MFARIATGWELMKQSFRVLRDDKELVVFPFFSGIACLLVLASFALPLWDTPWLREMFADRQAPQDPMAYVLLFAFYVVNYFVIVFFNSALVSCALKRFAGGNPTIGYGLQQASNRFPQILAWAIVSATVGIILKAIESKSQKIGALVASLIGAGWAIATYFVVPILVVEKVGPIDALKRSASLMRRTWGETRLPAASSPCWAAPRLSWACSGSWPYRSSRRRCSRSCSRRSTCTRRRAQPRHSSTPRCCRVRSAASGSRPPGRPICSRALACSAGSDRRETCPY
jgi:uncharacterized membrane protein YeaQ/YmgE (transglycosylase-associated protein family)